MSIQAATEAQCSGYRLDQNGGPFEKLPVYDQNRYAKEDSNLCYAVSAALLIDSNRHERGATIPPFTAPLSVALNFKVHMESIHQPKKTTSPEPSKFPYSLVGAGDIFTAINANQSKNVCDQRFLQNFDDAMGRENLPKVKIGSELDSSTKNFLSNVLDQIERYERDSQIVKRTNDRAESLNQFFRCRNSTGASNVTDILAAAKAAHQAANPLRKAAAFVEELCKSNSFAVTTPPAGNIFAELGDNGKKIEVDAKLNELLKSKKAVGVGFCHDALATKGEANCSRFHASVIIGRRFNQETNTCELLVRDSYGPSCKTPHGTPRYVWPCERGNVWVPSETFIKSIYNVSWIP